MSYTIYNENFDCYFCSPFAGAGNSTPEEGKRGFLEQELQFLATMARLITGDEIILDHYNAAVSLTFILRFYYEHPELHKIWCRFYGYQRDTLSLYNQYNHDIANDIYDCFLDPSAYVHGKYIPEREEESEAPPTEEPVAEEPVAEAPVDSVPIESTPAEAPPAEEPVAEEEPTPVEEEPSSPFDWSGFADSLGDIVPTAPPSSSSRPKRQPKPQPTPSPKAPRPVSEKDPLPSRRYRGGKRAGGYKRK